MNIRNKKAYSLMEALVGIGIMALIAIVFITSVITAFDNLRRIVELRTANLILQERVSITRDMDFSAIQSIPASFPVTSAFLNNPTGTIATSPYNGNNNMLKVTFILDWTAFNDLPARRTLVTLITDSGIDKK